MPLSKFNHVRKSSPRVTAREWTETWVEKHV